MDLSVLEENSGKASQLLRVMSNKKRLMILCNLLAGECSVQELQSVTGMKPVSGAGGGCGVFLVVKNQKHMLNFEYCVSTKT